jgi:Fe-S-cluster containining protein
MMTLLVATKPRIRERKQHLPRSLNGDSPSGSHFRPDFPVGTVAGPSELRRVRLAFANGGDQRIIPEALAIAIRDFAGTGPGSTEDVIRWEALEPIVDGAGDSQTRSGKHKTPSADERKRAVFARQKQRYAKDRLGVILQDSGKDKYAFERTAEIDCADRVHLCKASCCRLPFALSRQDIEERVVRWDFGVPYMIEQGADGYCTHHDRCTRRCTIYQERPVPCRGYDCRNDKRIWLDFERRIPNPAIGRADWLDLVSQESAG